MNHGQSHSWRLIAYAFASAGIICFWLVTHRLPVAHAQDSVAGTNGLPNVVADDSAAAEQSSADPPTSGVDSRPTPGDNEQSVTSDSGPNFPPRPSNSNRGLNLFMLLSKAGWFFMVPIWIASIGVGALTIERLLALRRARVMPDRLVYGLGKLAGSTGGFDPRAAYRLCQQFPSAASSVVRAMLLKVGRPHSEVEHAVREASDREANRLYSRVRWLTLAAAVAPLWGLLGTVWGMMMAFYDTTQLGYQHNKAEALAEGIYTALVTTLCGLFIAIPSAIMAHYLEGKIHELFRQIDELLFSLLPQIERYEGRIRFNRRSENKVENGDPPSADVMDDDSLQIPTPI